MVSERPPLSVRPVRRDRSAAVFRWVGVALGTTVWVSATLFGWSSLACSAGKGTRNDATCDRRCATARRTT
jgi:hypothetical protein